MNNEDNGRASDAHWRLLAARDASDHAAETFLKAFGVVLAVALVFLALLFAVVLGGCGPAPCKPSVYGCPERGER